MRNLKKVISGMNRSMAAIAGVTLLGVMVLTVVDVILRYFGRPITGVYDIVALGGAIVIGFSIPYAAEKRVHVFMEMLQSVHSRPVKQVLDSGTRLLGVAISLLIAWNLVKLGTGFHTTGEASLTVQIAFWPIAIGMGLCFILQALVFVMQIFQVFSGGSNE
jgi:TRAP-type C4-dicarboxylate transport system permease small subunit